MTASLVAACIWVLAGAITAAFPIRYQMVPGSILLLTAVPLMIWIGAENGWYWTLIGIMAFLSMFRRPLVYLLGRARGERPDLPR